MLEAVVDTNVLVSALIKGRVTAAIYAALLEKKFRPVYSDDLLDELLSVLARREFGLSTDELEQLRTLILLHGRFVSPTRRLDVCRDPADNRILECALAGRVGAIVTGDHDLLTLRVFHGVAVLTPRAFLSRLS